MKDGDAARPWGTPRSVVRSLWPNPTLKLRMLKWDEADIGRDGSPPLCSPPGDWGFFLYKKRLFSIQDIIIYHYISRSYHCVSLCIIVDITIYHVPRRHMISMIAMIHNTRHDIP
jgi:hypothetical protein